MKKLPTPKQIKETRLECGYTQSDAADFSGVSLRAWQLWESGNRKISKSAWEIFLIKSGIHPIYGIKK